MMYWKIYYQPAVTQYQKDVVSKQSWMRVRFVDTPSPHVVCWECQEEAVSDLADRLNQWGKDVIAVQRESGTP